jgi:transposase InsO family protein
MGKAQAVLGSAATAVVGMENASSSGHATHRGGVASSWLSPVLEMALQNPAGQWPKAGGPGDSGADLSYSAREPTWGAPRIHGELLKLGFHLAEPTVSRWLRRVPRTPHPARRWLTFLRNHREAIAAMDFFTVPTITFGVLYCFFVIGHDRRKILRCNVTRYPSALWIGQQMREAWPYAAAHKFLLFDRDSKFGSEVLSAAREIRSQPVRTAFRSPWQNGVAERWVGSCRRDKDSFRTDGLPLASASTSQSRRGQALADIPEKPPRSDCGHGLLHRADSYLRGPVLLLCHRPRAAQDPALQRHAKSERSLDRTADAGSVAVRVGP